MLNISFYKFVEINHIENLREEILLFCKNHSLKGKILLANEGINGMVVGEKENIKAFEKFMHEKEEFKDVFFKEHETQNRGFKRMLVKPRKEIITFKQKVDMKKIGNHMKPSELKQLYEKGEEFAIIDTRNDYEYDIGHFKNAIKLDTREFSEFPKEIKRHEDKLKNKKIIMYCTGGVRCEKASAYMIEQGYNDVHQLDGGIINYGAECGDEFWEGKCFVFDERGAVEIDPKKQDDNYSQCNVCHVPCEEKHECPYCQKEYLQCSLCAPLMDNCCSKFCRNKLRLEK